MSLDEVLQNALMSVNREKFMRGEYPERLIKTAESTIGVARQLNSAALTGNMTVATYYLGRLLYMCIALAVRIAPKEDVLEMLKAALQDAVNRTDVVHDRMEKYALEDGWRPGSPGAAYDWDRYRARARGYIQGK